MAKGNPIVNRPRDRRSLIAVSALLLCMLSQVPATVAEDAAPSSIPSVRVVITTPPARGSTAHTDLTAAAGQHTVGRLDMTGGEIWTVSADVADRVLAVARRLGISASRVGADPAMAIRGMAAGTRMRPAEKSMMAEAMRQPAAMSMMMAETAGAAMTEFALTATDHAGAPATVRLALTDDLTVEAVRQRLEKTGGGYVWHGVIVGSDDPVTLLWWPSGRLAGQILYRDEIYSIRHLGRTMHGVIAMSPRRLPPEHAPMPSAMMKKMKMDRDPLVREGSAEQLHRAMRPKLQDLNNQRDIPPSGKQNKAKLTATDTRIGMDSGQPTGPIELTLLVAYTGRAARAYTDIRRDLIALATEETNASFVRSGMENIRVRLVHAYQTRYREMGTHFEHLFRFADSGDGLMEEVHQKRNRYKADMAILIVDDRNGCGLSAGIAPAADRAFAVVHHECAATSYSLAHELGHILGARHDRAFDEGGAPFPFGHGYVHGRQWRTMMSYDESCGKCPRLPVWSNPDLSVRGVPAGDSASDNARAIRQRAAVVAAFR
jgi:hypothetical protein